MKININKDFLKEYKNDFWKGFSMTDIIHIAEGFLCAGAVVAGLVLGFKIPITIAIYCAVPVAAPVIFIGFYKYQGYLSVKELVKHCQQKAYPSPDAKAGWSSRSIYRILANECYTGKIVQGKTRTVSYKNQARIQIPPEEWIRIAHVHEPIISEEMFFFVQEKKHRRFTE